MEYRNLGRTGVKVSQFCLGAMMFGRQTNEADSVAIIQHALDAGINFIDTANAYSAGASEKFVGKALANGKRANVVLATKAFFPVDQKDLNGRGLSRRHIIEACNASLERLGTDWIDLYQLHRAQPDIPIDETLRALDDLIRAGKVRYIGTSMFPSWKIVEGLWAAKEFGTNRFVSEQMAYNLLDRTAEREIVPMAQTFGIALMPWAPLCGGLLTGKYRRDDQSAAGRWNGGKDNFGRPATPAAFDVIEGVVALAKEKGCTPSQLALAWNAAQPGITAPIVGATRLEQLDDAVAALALQLTADELAALQAPYVPHAVVGFS